MGDFTTVRLANQRVLVRGTDTTGVVGETVVSSAEWDGLNARSQFDEATKEFDAAIEEFFAPIVAAAEKIEAAVEQKQDPSSFVVIGDEVEHVQGEAAHVVVLSHDSQVLRLIEENDTDRLVWVAGDLEITEYVASDVASEPVESDVTSE